MRILTLISLALAAHTTAFATSIVLTGPAGSTIFGHPVTLIATATPATATGNVTFYDGTTVLGTRTLSNGSAAFTTSLLPSGERALKAYYGGDASDAPAASAVLSLTVTALPQQGFQAAVSYNAGSNPAGVAVGDFNGDGKADLALANEATNNISVLPGNGDGTFQPPLNSNAGSGPFSLAVGDFNADGKADLAVSNSNSNNVSILLGNGDGTFQTAVNYPVGSSPHGIVVGDFNGDGKPDLAVLNEFDGTIGILPGNGNGTFQPVATYPAGSSPEAIAIGDFNGDGKADLVVANNGTSIGGGNIGILLGNGDGTFMPVTTFATDYGTVSVAVGDFNGDGKADLAAVNSLAADMSILLGNGDGTFQAAVNYPAVTMVPTLAVGIALGDFNGDGITDLAMGNARFSVVCVLFGNGNGTFQAPVGYPTGFAPSYFAVGDFNGEGGTDLAVSGGSVNVLIGKQPFTTTALTSSSNPSNYGQRVTLTAAVSPSAATGNVTFYDGTTVLGTAAIAGGQATLTTSLLASGARSLAAYYSGDGTHTSDTSPVLTQLVIALPENGFQSGVEYPAGIAPVQFAKGDFNGDGVTDLVAANPGNNGISVVPGNGNGSFQAPVSYSTGTGADFIAVGDFNGDGKADLAVANYGANNVSILLGNGDGTFQPAVNYSATGPPVSVTVGDFNGDGKPDLAIATGNGVNILTGNGDGTFAAASSYIAGVQPRAIVTGDFNRDGNTDLAVANYGSNNVSILLGNGDGTFRNPVDYAASSEPYSIAVADFNHDGFADLAIANFGDGKVSVLPGRGGGTFQATVNYAVGTSTSAVTVEDFNGDGNPDLAVAGIVNGVGAVVVMPGKGDGTFQPGVNYVVSGSPISLIAGNFTGDGRVDLAVALSNANDVLILPGQAPGPTSTTLSSSTNPSVYGHNVTLTATISLSSATGSVTFYDGVNILGVSPVKNGSAVMNTVLPASGARSLRAFYTGGTGLASTSAVLTQTVNQMPQAGFDFGATYSAQGNAQSIAVGDFNGDGKPDLAVASDYVKNVGVLLNNGDGIYQTAVLYPAGYAVVSIATSDFNGDGKADLVTANNGDNTASVLLGNGDGTFQAPVSMAAGDLPQSVVVGDFNGDGKADFAVAASNGVRIFLGNGDGTFQAGGTYAASGSPLFVTAGDFNGDGKTDLVVVNSFTANISVLIGNGDGTFLPAANYPAGQSPRSVAAGDFNGDGKADLAVVNYVGDNVSVLLGNGNGTFQNAGNYGVGSYPESIAAGDVNGDGKTDLIVANSNYTDLTNGNTVSVLIGNGNGTFQPAVNYGSSANPASVVVADLTGDGLADIVAGGGSGVTVLRGVAPSGTAAAGITLASSPNPATYGQVVTITATVTPSSATGSVTFYDDSPSDNTSVLGTSVLANGTASLTISLPGSGAHSLTARYEGDTNFAAANAPAITQTVNAVAANGFGAVLSYSVSAGIVVPGDFNRDGKQDAAVASGSSVSVLLGLGNGGFAAAVAYPVGGQAGAMATGDFNGDGKTDLAIADATPGSGVIHILLGNGDGTFQAPVNWLAGGGAGAEPVTLVVGDFNGDGFADLATSYDILLGNGDGTFGQPLPIPGIALAAGDFNGDGKIDLVTTGGATSGTFTVGVLNGNGDGTFTAAPAYVLGFSSPTSSGPNPTAVTVGDFNGDGKPDLAVTTVTYNSGNAFANSALLVLAGNGDGTFRPVSSYTPVGDAISLTTGDFNGDGKPDIAVGSQQVGASEPTSRISIFFGQGTGTFQTPVVYVTGDHPTSMATGDFNGDGRVDLMAANNTAQTVSMYLSVAGSGITLEASPDPSVYSQPVTLTATVSPLNATGYVTFFEGTNVLGTSPVSNGNATFTTSSLPTGTGLLRATYGGDTTHTVSTSASVTQTVTPVPENLLTAGSSFGAGSMPQSIAVADFNGDGKPDLAVVNSGNVGIFLGSGSGTFQFSANYGYESASVAAADFNQDGKVDLIVGGAAGLQVLLGNGDGTFRVGMNSPSNPYGELAVGDFNGDGKPDVAYLIYDYVGILSGNGDGTFSTGASYATGDGATSLAVADFNGDGKADLTFVNFGDNTVSELLGNGDGSFQPAVNYPTGAHPDSVAVRDFNGDGVPDLAIANYQGNTLSVILGTGGLGTYATGREPTSVAVGDFNGDGNPDLIVANFQDNTVGVYPGNGKGAFAAPVTYAVGAGPQFVAVADFNGDGRADVAVANASGNSVTILLGVAPGLPQSGPSEAGIFRNGNQWLLDANNDHLYEGPPQDIYYINFITPQAGDLPVVGDWSGTGTTKIGIYRPSTGEWFLDYNGDGVFDAGDKTCYFGGIAGDLPVVGDWTGSGTSKIGIFRSGFYWLLDSNGDGSFDNGDQSFAFGGVAGDVPVTGDWNGTGITKVGVVRPFQTGGTPAFWLLDANNDHTIDTGDLIFAFGGITGDVPVVGDWNGTGFAKAGVYRDGFYWVVDNNGSAPVVLGSSQVVAFAYGGIAGDVPITGKW